MESVEETREKFKWRKELIEKKTIKKDRVEKVNKVERE